MPVERRLRVVGEAHVLPAAAGELAPAQHDVVLRVGAGGVVEGGVLPAGVLENIHVQEEVDSHNSPSAKRSNRILLKARPIQPRRPLRIDPQHSHHSVRHRHCVYRRIQEDTRDPQKPHHHRRRRSQHLDFQFAPAINSNVIVNRTKRKPNSQAWP